MEILIYILLAALGLFLLYWLMVIASAYLLVSTKKVYEKNSRFFRFLLYSTTRIALFFVRIKVNVNNKSLIPTDGRFVLVQNHRSNYDALLTWRELPEYDLAFITKEENMKIPIWGRIIRKCLFLPINREDPRKAIPTIKKAAEFIDKNEVSIAVYPEGTRSKNCVLLDFHAAVFKIAQMAKVPVVVTTIRGTEKIYKQMFIKRSIVDIDVLEVIPAEEVVSMKSTELSDRVRRIMQEHLE